MEESIYNLCLLCKSSPFGIVGIQSKDTLILPDKNFASKKEAKIKIAKIMTKDQEYFTSIQLLKFNRTQIKFDSKDIVLTKESHVREILLEIDHNKDSTSSREITRKKLSPMEYSLTQKARDIYIFSICQSKASFDLF